MTGQCVDDARPSCYRWGMILGVPDDSVERKRLADALVRGARIVRYSYALAFIVLSVRRFSEPIVVEPGADSRPGGWPYTLLSLEALVAGTLWGPIHAWESYRINANGGMDVTREMAEALDLSHLDLPAPLDGMAEFNPNLDRFLPLASNIVLIGLMVAFWVLGTHRVSWPLKDHLILAGLCSVVGTLTSIVVLLPFGALRGSSPLWQLNRGPLVFTLTTAALFLALIGPRFV
jgi:hypothetical protein